MKKTIYFFMILTTVMLLSGMTSCNQDEVTINQNITGEWQADDSQTAYNGGLVMSQLGVNTDSIGALITPVFAGCNLSFNAGQAGTMKFPVLLETSLPTTYTVSSGAVTINSALLSKSIKLTISSITATEMHAAIEVADVTTLVGIVDTTATNNTSIVSMIESMVPAISNIQKMIDNSGVNLNSLGLNPNPTVTLVFKKK